MKLKSIALLILCLSAIVASGLHLYRTQFARPAFNEELHRGLGQALVDRLAELLPTTGRVVVVTLDPGRHPELRVQAEAFEKALEKRPGLRIKETYHIETEDKKKYGFGSGLTGKRYVRVVNKNQSADAIVSFVGAPDLSDQEVEDLRKRPLFIAECRSPEKLKRLFEKGVIHSAIVGRFTYPTPIKGTPRTPQEWVQQRFEFVTTNDLAELPSGGGE